jgi:hypothetical protein
MQKVRLVGRPVLPGPFPLGAQSAGVPAARGPERDAT